MSHLHSPPSYSADAEPLCQNCFEPTTKRCSGCSKVYFCSEECQKRRWPLHIFDCSPANPPNTAYHLLRAVAADMIPSHPQTCIDYGFARCKTEDENSNLFSLYVGLIKLLEVDPLDLHRARRKGKLVDEIKKHYEALPKNNRGVYYPWFLENQHIVDPKTPTYAARRGTLPNPINTFDGNGNDSVEDLLRLLADANSEVIPSVGVDYGLWNCKTPMEKARLLDMYCRYFEHPNAHQHRMHQACIKGKVFEHVSSLVPMSAEEAALMRRLMQNPYPLAEY